MIPGEFDYYAPGSLSEAVTLLQEHGEDAKLLAGGQSLIPAMRFRLAMPFALIDLNNIDGLEYVREDNGHLAIGSMTREVMLEESSLVNDSYQMLADAAEVIADPVVRNRATVGGNIAHADPANDTWPGDSWRTGGAPVWITGSFDPALGLTYWGTGNPGPWTGDQRPGDNLYTNSVVALDVDTGRLRAYHQYHWNDSWDWDEVSAPLLIDLPRGGRTVPGLVHPGRNGYLWFLERRADAISFISAKPYVAQNVFTSIDPTTGRPQYDEAHKPAVGHRVTFCPSLWGGKDWPPAAYSPRTGYLYIPANENHCREMEGQEVEYRRGQQFTGASTDFSVAEGADHIGELQAWDMKTGELAWTQEFASPNWGPVLATAGGLVFAGGTSDRYFRAFDAASGRQLWQYRTNSGITGVPTSYEVDGVQYVAVQSGWGVDAQGMLGRIDRARGTETIVPQGGVIWVFALHRR
jgi:alcohol dehydrogenase (cytochrome c)